MTRATAPLVLAAHGSADPGFHAVITTLASTVASARPGLDVRIGYLEHGPPDLADVADPGTVVVPALLTNGYHAHIDIPSRAPGATIAAAIGPDPRLARVLANRLREAGWDGRRSVAVVGAGSADEAALDDVRRVAHALTQLTGAAARAVFAGSGEPALATVAGEAVVPYLIGPGRYAAVITGVRSPVRAAPLGAHPLLAEIVLDRYDEAVAGQPGAAPRRSCSLAS